MIRDFNRRVYGYECDMYGHMNNAHYFHLLEAARTEAMMDIQMPMDLLQKLGWHVYIHRYEVEYKAPLMLDEIGTVKSRIVEMNRARSKWLQEVFNTKGVLCFTAFVYVVHVRDGKPARVPDEIWTHFLRLQEAPILAN